MANQLQNRETRELKFANAPVFTAPAEDNYSTRAPTLNTTRARQLILRNAAGARAMSAVSATPPSVAAVSRSPPASPVSERDDAAHSSTQPAAREAGRIELIVGPMFAGKSTELMRLVRRHKIAGCSTCVIKYGKDTRYGESSEVASHDQVKMEGRAVLSLAECPPSELQRFDVVAVDEGQFFPTLPEWARELSAAGTNVVVAGLDGDFRAEPFGEILRLVPLADKVTKLLAVCGCGKDAAFTRRDVASNAIEVIGGSETYSATCRGCHIKPCKATLGVADGEE